MVGTVWDCLFKKYIKYSSNRINAPQITIHLYSNNKCQGTI